MLIKQSNEMGKKQSNGKGMKRNNQGFDGQIQGSRWTRSETHKKWWDKITSHKT